MTNSPDPAQMIGYICLFTIAAVVVIYLANRPL